MKVLVTGANGFIGRALVRTMLAGGRLARTDGSLAPIDELVLVDRSPVLAPDAPGIHIRTLDGDLRDDALLAEATGTQPDSIFHLAATLTIDAENDPASGWAINMQLPWRLLEACRGAKVRPRFVYASSIAVFGGHLPERVDDTQFRTPKTSYGTAKAITELLIDDYSRKGIVDGRALRLPVVLLRPPAATRTMSDIIAAIAREPLCGRSTVSPLGADLRFPVVSVQRVAANLLRLHDIDAGAFGDCRSVNQPGLSVSVADIVAALGRVAGPGVAARVAIEPDPAVEAVMRGWPTEFVSDYRFDPALDADPDFDAILRGWLDETREEAARTGAQAGVQGERGR